MATPTGSPPPNSSKSAYRQGLRLSTKLILPLFLVFTLLAVTSIFGSMQLIRESTTDSEHRRLTAAKEIVFRQFRQQEKLLLTYSSFLEDFHSLPPRSGQRTTADVTHDRFLASLEKAGVTVAYYPADREVNLPSGIGELFQQVRRSGETRFRYINELGTPPTLVAATPLYLDREVSSILVLTSTFGSDFLDRIAEPLDIGAALHDLSGKMLTSSKAHVTPMTLSIEQLKALAAKGNLFIEHNAGKHLFSLLPVGEDDLLLLCVESSDDLVAALEASMLLRLSLSIALALALGIILYFRAIAVITRPARELVVAAKAISRGNFSYRIEDITRDELGEVAATFNQMAEQIDTIYQQKSVEETESVVALQEAKTRALLEHKNREIERINEELRGHLREVSALYQLNQVMVSNSELKVMFDRTMQTIIETLACDHVVIMLFDTKSNHLEVAGFAGLSTGTIEDIKFSLDQGVTGLAARSMKQVYVKDVSKDQRYLSYHARIAVRGSFVASPLVVKKRLIGVLNLHKRDTNAFPPSELKMIQAIANQMAIATENTRLIEKARDSANIDEVTGLANRRYFQEILKREVAQARRFNAAFSVVMCTIDNFMLYIEKHGRAQGDALLHRVGTLLLNNTRGIDLVCRFGNQDFAILLPKTKKDGGHAASEKLRQFMEKEVLPAGGDEALDKHMTLSFGVAEFPTDSKNIYELINLADRALLQARRDGSNRTVAWEEFMASAEE